MLIKIKILFYYFQNLRIKPNVVQVNFQTKSTKQFVLFGTFPKNVPNKTSQKLFYIGLRDVDDYESFLLQKLNISTYGMNSVDNLGINKILEEILDNVDQDSKLHISFDIDALDIKEAPSTGTAVRGGLTLREGLLIVETLAETNRISGFDLVEINPNIGSEDDIQQTVKAGIELVKAAFGYNRSGTPKDILS